MISITLMLCFVMVSGAVLASNRSYNTDIDLKTINKYIAENPHDPNLYFVKGQLLVSKNKTKKAKSEFEKVINIYPGFNEAYLELAQLGYRLEEYDEALQHIDTYLKSNPDDVKAMYTKGEILLGSGKYDEVLTLTDQMIELDNQNGKAYLLKGEANYELTNYDEAYESWQTSMKLGEVEAGVHLKYLFEPVW